MKYDRNTLIIIFLTIVVVLSYSIFNLYLHFFPLPKTSLETLDLKEIETNINWQTIQDLKNSF